MKKHDQIYHQLNMDLGYILYCWASSHLDVHFACSIDGIFIEKIGHGFSEFCYYLSDEI